MSRKSKHEKADDRTGGEKLIDAIKANDLPLVQQLIADGADVNEMPEEETPYVETLKILIDAGASVKVAMFGMTPLDLANEAKCQPIIELFEAALANEKPAAKGKTKKK